ncbi:aspartate/glutamate racemase family protein [Niallia sp. 01092]|uniref:aspartate/glutamate racemase family protein n=1 Tax=unclassified Niallia TaxID=2837522 RepID=UPI003FD5B1D0
MQKVVGIIGGMGPLATVDLMNKIISRTPARKDQDHIHIMADNYAQIPDRTKAIMGKGIDPAPYMIQSAQRLQNAGADFLVIACNTAHYFFEPVKKFVVIPIMHMPLETTNYLHKKRLKKVGLLATDGTTNTEIYQNSCQEYEIEVINPDTEMQKKVMEAIYAIKGGNLEVGQTCLLTAANNLINQGAEAIIAGCTEIPLVLKPSQDICVIDPTEILAKAVIKKVNGKEQEMRMV